MFDPDPRLASTTPNPASWRKQPTAKRAKTAKTAEQSRKRKVTNDGTKSAVPERHGKKPKVAEGSAKLKASNVSCKKSKQRNSPDSTKRQPSKKTSSK
jgi:hypothetical protein